MEFFFCAMEEAVRGERWSGISLLPYVSKLFSGSCCFCGSVEGNGALLCRECARGMEEKLFSCGSMEVLFGIGVKKKTFDFKLVRLVFLETYS